MIFEVDHTPEFWAGMKRVHWRVASDIGAAVVRFARERAHRLPTGPRFIPARGHAEGYRVAVIVDWRRSIVIASYFYRAVSK